MAKKKMDAFTARFYAKAGQFDVKPVKKRHTSFMSTLKKDKLKEVIGDATKRSKGSRLKGIE